MRLRLVVFLPFLFCGSLTPVHAQMLDSIRSAVQVKPKFVFGLSSRFSSVDGSPSRTSKLFVGYDYDRVFRLELGINYMPNPGVTRTFPFPGDTLLETNQLTYLGLQAEYTFYRKGHWKFGFPVQVGIGSNKATERYNNHLRFSRTFMVIPVEPGLNALYYFYDWIGLKAGMGVRMSFGKAFSVLSGPYYNMGIAFFPGTLYQRIKDKRS